MKKLLVLVLVVIITLGASSVTFAAKEDIPRLLSVNINEVNLSSN